MKKINIKFLTIGLLFIIIISMFLIKFNINKNKGPSVGNNNDMIETEITKDILEKEESKYQNLVTINRNNSNIDFSSLKDFDNIIKYEGDALENKIIFNQDLNNIFIVEKNVESNKNSINHYEFNNNKYIKNTYSLEIDKEDILVNISIDNDHIYIVGKNNLNEQKDVNIYKFSKETSDKIETIKLKNIEIENGFVYNNSLFSFFDTYIVKTNLSDNESEILNLGEKLEDYYLVNNKLYVFNKFGHGLNNSLLFELDLNKFRVIDLFETKDNRVYIKGFDLLNNIVYFQSEEIDLSILVKENKNKNNFKIIEHNFKDKTFNTIDTIMEFEGLIDSMDKTFNNEFFILR